MSTKKQPGDYPQFSFRVSQEDKTRIHELTEEVLRNSNAQLKPEQKILRKNDVLVDALYLGLLTLQKKGMRRLK